MSCVFKTKLNYCKLQFYKISMHIHKIYWLESWCIYTFRIHPNLKRAIYCSAIAAGDEDDWEFVWEEYQRTTVAAEKDKLRYALSCTKEIWLLNRSGQWFELYTISTDTIFTSYSLLTFIIQQISWVHSWPFKDKKNGYGLYRKLHCQKCRRPASRMGFCSWQVVLYNPRVS